jgi:hypothetical protein
MASPAPFARLVPRQQRPPPLSWVHGFRRDRHIGPEEVLREALDVAAHLGLKVAGGERNPSVESIHHGPTIAAVGDEDADTLGHG